MRNLSAWLLPAALLATACAGIAPRSDDQSQLDRYLRYAGAPIESFTYLGRYSGWHAVAEDKLVLWTGINDAYLLTLRQPCTGLQFAERIGVTSTADTVSHLESVTFDHQRCPINEIRPIDYRRMRQDASQKAQQAS
jgi:hypothetical protein